MFFLEPQQGLKCALHLAVITCNFQYCREQEAVKNHKYSSVYKVLCETISHSIK